MPFRVIALLLAVLLLWSGLNTIELPRFTPPSPEQPHVIVHASGQAAAHAGSVEHHHLDDLPSQAQGDAPTETPGLLATPVRYSPLRSPSGHPPSRLLAAAGSPFLDGPLRPPCAAALAG